MYKPTAFITRIVDTWNNLGNDVVIAESLNSFKNRLDNSWKDNPKKFEIVFDDNNLIT